ncbi:MAG: bifunctional enoyl-CoA hydratase/phosphate acetyltransferase [Pseudomonadota bacterium]
MNTFSQVEEAIKDYPVRRVAVAVAQDGAALEAVAQAQERDIAHALLVGDRDAIEAIAEEKGLDLGEAEIQHEPDPLKAAAAAVAAVHDGRADILMKGYLHTDDFLRALLHKEHGLRTEAILSHVFLVEQPGREGFLFVTDSAMNITPDLERKAAIILNAVHTAQVFGLPEPRVAVLAAVEVVNPAMPATLDAAALNSMFQRRQFSPRCVIDGPFAFDNAVNAIAAHHKKIDGPVAGRADVLVVPNIESGNILVKCMVHVANLPVAGLLVGARAPVVLTSRADSAQAKLASIACAVFTANVQRELRLKVGKFHF